MKVWVPRVAVSVLRFAFSSSSFSFLASSSVCYTRMKADVLICIFLLLEDDLENYNNKLCKIVFHKLYFAVMLERRIGKDKRYSTTERCGKH